MNYQEAVAWLHSLGRISKAGDLSTIKSLLAALGNPEDKLKFVHIAGTNGKGSATIMLASVLKEAGYKTGANISPYVLDFRERFQINGEMISEECLADIVTKVRKAAESLKNTAPVIEFEAVTAAALCYFAQEACDIVCLEVGLGGRLDATNAVQNTLVACIMRIGMDHTELLGDTYTAIAAEKCGIIKNGCTVISYPAQTSDAALQIETMAQDAECELIVPQIEDLYIYKNAPFENRFNYGGYDLSTPLSGQHQAFNACVVVEAALALWRKGFNIEDEHIINGIKKAAFPARIEVIQTNPLIIIDGAHNPDGAEALRLELLRSETHGLIAVMGILHDKNSAEMLAQLAPCFSEVYTVAPDNPRAMSAEELAALASEYFKTVKAYTNVQDAIADAKKAAKHGICICGSLYLAAQARKILVP
ncbi:MAG: folylpolyglutamate synthase/dihydrofolate synthase family protein [Oscillospiraceae bacterium]